MSVPPAPPGEHRSLPVVAGFVRRGDYAKVFLSDVVAAVPKAPLTAAKALYWYATKRYVRARNRVQEIVGRRLGFALPSHLTKAAPRALSLPGLRWAALIPVPDGVPIAKLRTTLASLPPSVDAVVAVADPSGLGEGPTTAVVPGARTVAALLDGAARHCDHDVLLILHPGNALLEGAVAGLDAAFAVRDVEAAFADELLALPDRMLPLLKPDFDEELLLQVDLVGDFLAIRRDALLRLGGFGEAGDEGLCRDLLLRLVAARGPKAIGHAYGAVHGRDLRGRRAHDQPAALLAATRAHLDATDVVAEARIEPASGRIEILRSPGEPPPVTVIVPTRDRADLLVPCLEGLLSRTAYPRIEVAVIDNGSSDPETLARFEDFRRDPRVRILPMPGPFNFSRLNNEAAASVDGGVLVFMNNDVEVMAPDWLDLLVAEAVRPDVGAVGPKLLYPNGLVQHAGVVLGLMGGPAGHAFHLFHAEHPGYLHMLDTTRRCSAITAACLAVTRDKFERVGGFDAEAFPVALNDVDLCLRLDAAAHRNLYVGKAVLLHKESATRPSDVRPDQRARYERELATFRERWADRLAGDPWYNRLHGQALADFTVPQWRSAHWPPDAPC